MLFFNSFISFNILIFNASKKRDLFFSKTKEVFQTLIETKLMLENATSFTQFEQYFKSLIRKTFKTNMLYLSGLTSHVNSIH